MSDLDDSLMAQISQSGDTHVRERAFHELVRRHAGALNRFLRTYQADPAERDDLVQEAFLRVYQSCGHYTPGKARFSTWLYTIGRNLALDARRRRDRRPAEPLVDEGFSADSGSGPIKQVILGQEAAGVRAAVERLPEADREAVVLRFYEDLSHADIAAVLGSSPAAVKQRIWRAMGKLRFLLHGEPSP